MKRVISSILAICITTFSTYATAEYDSYEKHKKNHKKPEHGFYKAAKDYKKLSDKYKNKGMVDVASSYERMAEIKNNAGKLADQNKWDEISWEEYHKLEKDINSMLSHKKGKPHYK